MNFSQEVTNYINMAPSDQLEIMETLRLLIHKNVKRVSEAVKWGMPVFSNGNNFCYFRSNKNHVTFGFYNPERIHDPDNLLEGTGQVMKHVKIKSMENIDNEQLAKWIRTVAH